MAQISFKQFKGSTPRVAKHLVSAPAASRAVDCKLWHGDLSSWYEPRKVNSLQKEDGFKYEMLGCCWVKLPRCASIAEGNVHCDKYYVTGRMPYPEEAHINFDTCEVTWYRLGLPCPYKAPEVFVSEENELNKNAENRVYVYQFVNSRGQRSAASSASEPITVLNEGTPVVVSGWEVPDKSWDVRTVRIYRSVSGMETGREAGNMFDTAFMFVGEVGLHETSFTDTMYSDDLADALAEDIVMPPPAGIGGITLVSSQNSLAAYQANELLFSVNNEQHNWNIKLTLDDNIRGMVESGGLLYVATDGRPYVVNAAADCKTAECRQVTRHSDAYPMISGDGKMVATPAGAVYVSTDGIVLLAGNNPPRYLTNGLYAPDDWHKLIPESLSLTYHQGYLYGWGARGSFVMQLSNASSTGWELDQHSELSDVDVYYALVSRTGNLYIMKPDGIYLWNAGTAKRPHLWVSGEAVTGVPINFAAVKLFMTQGSENVKIHADDRYIFDREVVRSNQPMSLPLWGTGQRFTFELSGTADVKLLAVATSVKELPA